MIGFELDVIALKFDRFGWQKGQNTPAQDRLIADWMAVLQDYPLDEVKAAIRAHIAETPRVMPHEGHIVAQITKARAKLVASRPRVQETMPDRDFSPEAVAARRANAAEILKKTGMARSHKAASDADRF